MELGFNSLFNGPVGLDRRFLDQHDGYVVPDGINPVTLDAFEALLVGRDLDVAFAFRAGEDFEKKGVQGHDDLLSCCSAPGRIRHRLARVNNSGNSVPGYSFPELWKYPSADSFTIKKQRIRGMSNLAPN